MHKYPSFVFASFEQICEIGDGRAEALFEYGKQMISPLGLTVDNHRHRVFLKKVLHKPEEKMQEKLKLIWQKDKNSAQE